MKEQEIIDLKIKFLELQRDGLVRRYERQKARTAFIKKNLKKILALSVEGWPRTKGMKDYIKWIDIVYAAKIKGIYSIGTANCDVIIQLNRFAKELNTTTK